MVGIRLWKLIKFDGSSAVLEVLNTTKNMSWITVGKLNIYYDAPRGLPTSESDPILLLIHGAGGSSCHWMPMVAKLGEGIFPVAIDLPGHAASEGYLPDSIDAIAAFCNAFLDSLGVNRPICYVGHSLGGLIGMQFTLSYPDRVNRLVLIGTAARIQLHPDFLQQALTGQWDLAWLEKSFAPEVPDNVKEIVLSQFKRTRFTKDTSKFMGLSLIDLNNAVSAVGLSLIDLNNTVSALRVPTLILSGDDDVIISPRKSVLLHRQISGSRLVTIPGAGHYLHIEKAAIVAEEITHFLEHSALSTIC